jgi:hypothetical protein
LHTSELKLIKTSGSALNLDPNPVNPQIATTPEAAKKESDPTAPRPLHGKLIGYLEIGESSFALRKMVPFFGVYPQKRMVPCFSTGSSEVDIL